VRGLPFQFEVPVTFFEKAGEEPGKRRRIGGIISTEAPDRQNETVLADALVLDDFLKAGWFNDNHSRDTDGIVGYPEATRKFKKGEQLPNGEKAKHAGHWAEGYMLGTERANKIWELGKALQGTGRRLGFSVEGKILARTGPKTIVKKGDDGQPQWVGERIAKAVVRNVAITNCFPGDVRVSGVTEKVMRRLYSGPMVELHLASGEKITGTPNHPIFTERGWVALGDLDERYDRVGRFNGDFMAASRIAHDVEHMPPMLQEVFDLASLAKSSRWVGLAGESQFHGDVSDSDVDVVLADGFLKDHLDTLFFQKFGKDALPASDKQEQSFSGLGAGMALVGAGLGSPARSVGSSGEGLALSRGALDVAADLVIMPTAGDAGTFGDVENRDARNAVTLGDSGRTLAASIGFSNIVLKRVFDFSGHVFNLQTQHGWYEANGIIAHNCPVNTDTGLEILTKSLEAFKGTDPDDLETRVKVLEKMMAMGHPIPGHKFNGPQSGEGAGQVLAPQSLEHDFDPRKELSKGTSITQPAPSSPGVQSTGLKHIRPPAVPKPARPAGAHGLPGQPADPAARAGATGKRSFKGKVTMGTQESQGIGPSKGMSKSMTDSQAMAWVMRAIPSASAAMALRVVELTKQLKRSGNL